jgi:hypothetical protein
MDKPGGWTGRLKRGKREERSKMEKHSTPFKKKSDASSSIGQYNHTVDKIVSSRQLEAMLRGSLGSWEIPRSLDPDMVRA